ncbi:MAG: VpaChn25_0724 family phage protein [Shimia sp.]
MMFGWPVKEVEQERRRLCVLQYLAASPQYRAQAPILKDQCNRLGIPTTADQMAACTAWLSEMELVELEAASDVEIARITRRGREVATGQVRLPGVMPPDP